MSTAIGISYLFDAVFVLLIDYRTGNGETHFFTAGCWLSLITKQSRRQTFRTSGAFAFFFN
jgi:hypothetical protein